MTRKQTISVGVAMLMSGPVLMDLTWHRNAHVGGWSDFGFTGAMLMVVGFAIASFAVLNPNGDR